MNDEPIELPDDVRSQRGDSLAALSRAAPVLVVCLRHGGCTFCKQALSDVSRDRATIEAAGSTIALVHMLDDPAAATMFEAYGLGDVPRFSDPDRRIYRALGLERGSTWRVMGPHMWGRAVGSIAAGHLPGVPRGDVFQMPGAFLIESGRIVRAYRHRGSSDRPDYVALATPPRHSTTATGPES